MRSGKRPSFAIRKVVRLGENEKVVRKDDYVWPHDQASKWLAPLTVEAFDKNLGWKNYKLEDVMSSGLMVGKNLSRQL